MTSDTKITPLRRFLTWAVVLAFGFGVGGGALGLMFHVLGLPLPLYTWVMIMVTGYFVLPFITGTVNQPILTRQRAAAFFGVIPIVAAAAAMLLLALGVQGWMLLYGFGAVLLGFHFVFVMWIEKR
ncbi:MAG TPA: hypothetical protein VMW17_06020 [Candidatus Binatia bacterium]|nr:hypothetical protein [Candidatus Binatia bacterium]